MRTTKHWFGLVGTLLPALFCGGLLVYLNGIRGVLDTSPGDSLGPTMFGLGAFGLLFLVLFLVKLWRLANPPAAGPGARAEAALEAERSDFDADAALARYLARRDAAPPGERPLTFGRKSG